MDASSGGVDGLLAGNPGFFFRPIGAAPFASVWAFVVSFGMLWLIDRITPVRVEDAIEEIGLDEGLYCEKAYLEEKMQ